MSAWPGKYVIGLTGNIATGKSVVRKMLEHLGAYGIDADASGSPCHRHGCSRLPAKWWIPLASGSWDRMGRLTGPGLPVLVFSDPDALTELESIVHPLGASGCGFAHPADHSKSDCRRSDQAAGRTICARHVIPFGLPMPRRKPRLLA